MSFRENAIQSSRRKTMSQTNFQQLPQNKTSLSPGWRKTAAILEVLGIYAAGQMLGMLLFAVLGSLIHIPLKNPLLEITASATQGDLLRITWHLLVLLLCQYAGWMVSAFVVGWWRRRRTPAQYGLTLAGRSIGFYLKAGVVVFAVAELFAKLLSLLDTLVPLGSQIAWREAIYKLDWTTPAFWLFMAVGSYGLVPILEELFYRGYIQTRLEEDFGAPVAILATAFLFALSHSQYLILNPFNIGMILSTIFGALVWGYIFYRTRSLLVTILAHAIVNIPILGIGLWIEIVAMLIVIVIARREIYRALVDGWSLLRSISRFWQAVGIVLLFSLFAVAFALLGDVVSLAGIVFFIAAMVLAGIEKRRAKSQVTVQRL
jgi:membrane protease YdiL (CAAX protease family)